MKRRIFAAVLSLSCVLLPACEANNRANDNVPKPANIAGEIAHQQAILLDVRTAEEYAAGHAPNATLIPYDSIAQQISGIAPDKNQKIYVYCRSGRRSGIAVETLKNMGYNQVTDLGGLGRLEQYGLTVQ